VAGGRCSCDSLEVEILVVGAGGYIGSRLVPALLEAGHGVRAALRVPARARAFHWHDSVETSRVDVTSGDGLEPALEGVDAVCYLVHSMGGRDFAETDRVAARLLAEAAEEARVSQVVYLSGLVPDVPPEQLSTHIASRLEVESILMMSTVPTVSLRAGIVLGSGSASFEALRQLSERLPVQTLPTWLTARVQPVAVVDAVASLVGALASGASRSYDIGGPDVVTYRELLALFADVAGLVRPKLDIPLLPTDLVGHLAGVVTDVPSSTLHALVQSLEHDMVCQERDFERDLLPEGHALVPLREALERALGRPDPSHDPGARDPLGPMEGDPVWAGPNRQRRPLDWAVAAAAAVAPFGLARLAR
jgi:uncharacterized protein YbjT (DUF2867 family)